MPLNQKPILVVCDAPWTANELVARITEARGDIVYAANELEALQQLKQFQCAAAVVTCLAHAHGVADALKRDGVPLCVLEESATAAAAPVGDVVGVADVDLVVPALRALMAQRSKGYLPHGQFSATSSERNARYILTRYILK